MTNISISGKFNKNLRVFFSRLEGLDPNAYEAFQTSRNLKDVVERAIKLKTCKLGLTKKLSVRANLMTPILPMLVSNNRGYCC